MTQGIDPSRGALANLLDELATQGTHVASGSFSVNAERAREQLEQYQLEDPNEYVLELLQASMALGATRIDIRLDADELWIESDASPPGEHELRELYALAMQRPWNARVAAASQLVVALGALKTLDVATVRILCAAEGGHWRWERHHGDDAPQIDWVEEELAGEKGFQLYVEERFKLTHLIEFVEKFNKTLPNEALIIDRACFARTPICINGRAISQLEEFPDQHLTPYAFEEGKSRGFIGVFLNDQSAAQMHVMQHGVVIQRLEQRDALIPFCCVVENDTLRKDLSQRAFVRDEAWQQMFEQVLTGHVRRAIAGELRKIPSEGAWPRWSKKLMLTLLEERAALGGINAADSAELAILSELKRYPGWQVLHPGPLAKQGVLAGAHISILKIREGLRHGSKQLHAAATPLDHPGDQMVLALDRHTEALAKYMGLELVWGS